ncbi:uncharacterized protein METZ01_LOCUS453068, partial [marine metagenome]
VTAIKAGFMRLIGKPRVRTAGLIIMGLSGLGAGLAWGVWAHICDDCPSVAQIYAFEAKEATQVFAADGSLLAQLAVERRTRIRIEDLPQHVYNTFIAVEDKRFWGHAGVDFPRTIRAFIDFVIGGYG